MVFLPEKLLSWALRVFFGVCNSLGMLDHLFYLFANTRPPNWLTGSIATFANPLVTCVDFIQRVQTKR